MTNKRPIDKYSLNIESIWNEKNLMKLKVYQLSWDN